MAREAPASSRSASGSLKSGQWNSGLLDVLEHPPKVLLGAVDAALEDALDQARPELVLQAVVKWAKDGGLAGSGVGVRGLLDDDDLKRAVVKAIRPSIGWQGDDGDRNARIAAGNVLGVLAERFESADGTPTPSPLDPESIERGAKAAWNASVDGLLHTVKWDRLPDEDRNRECKRFEIGLRDALAGAGSDSPGPLLPHEAAAVLAKAGSRIDYSRSHYESGRRKLVKLAASGSESEPFGEISERELEEARNDPKVKRFAAAAEGYLDRMRGSGSGTGPGLVEWKHGGFYGTVGSDFISLSPPGREPGITVRVPSEVRDRVVAMWSESRVVRAERVAASPVGDREQLIRSALSDPGKFVDRKATPSHLGGDDMEPIYLWQTRAVIAALDCEQEQCSYCKQWFPKPVELHHHESDCSGSVGDERPEGLRLTVGRFNGGQWFVMDPEGIDGLSDRWETKTLAEVDEDDSFGSVRESADTPLPDDAKLMRFECPVDGCKAAVAIADHARRDPADIAGDHIRCREHGEALKLVDETPLFESPQPSLRVAAPSIEAIEHACNVLDPEWYDGKDHETAGAETWDTAKALLTAGYKIDSGRVDGAPAPDPATYGGAIPLLKYIRGMCSDERPHAEIDAKVAEAIDRLYTAKGGDDG